jgi:dihydrofolate reductase
VSENPKIALIWAMSENRVIGKENGLPWHLPADLKHFKAMTLGKPVIMGRKTFESIGRALPGRENIVVTRRSGYQADGITVVNDPDEALEVGRKAASGAGVGEVMVIGGAEIYRLMMGRAQRLYITEIHGSFDGDARFPDFDPKDWVETSRAFHAAEGKDQPDYSFVVLDARAG